MKVRRLADETTPTPRAPGRRTYWPAGAPAVLALGVAFVEAGSSGGMLAYRLLTEGMLAAAWLAAMTGLGWVFVRKLPVPSLLRLATAAAMGMGMVSLWVLGLGLAGWMNGAMAWGIFLAGIAAGGWWLWKARMTPLFRPGEGGDRSYWRWLWVLLMPFLGLALVGAITPPGLLWQDEPAGYDVTEYHLQVPREWYEAGKITGLKHNVFSYMPMNVEMHDLLAMHLRGGPWAGMYLGQFIHVAIMALAVLAAAGVAGALSDKPWAGPLAGVAMGVVPWVTSLAPIAYNEGGLMLFGGLAIGWVLIARDWRGWLIAGVMAGLACGVKLTAAPMVVGAVVVAWGVVTVKGLMSKVKSGEWVEMGMFVLASVVVFAPWMIRNQIWTGNPVFPEAMEVLGKGHFSDVQVERWRKAHSPTDKEKTLGARLGAGWGRIAMDWRYGFLFLPLTLVAIGLGRDRRAIFLGAVLAVQLIIWLAFTHLEGRFFILAIPIGAMLIGLVRAQVWPWIAGGLIVVMALAGFLILNDRYSLVRKAAEQAAFGVEDLTWLVKLPPEIEIEKLPADRPIILVGDAEAFFYSGIPMTRLKYRTVFDVPGAAGGDWLNKWTGGARGTVVVFPGELSRFKKTYLSVPAPGDAELLGRGTYILQN